MVFSWLGRYLSGRFDSILNPIIIYKYSYRYLLYHLWIIIIITYHRYLSALPIIWISINMEGQLIQKKQRQQLKLQVDITKDLIKSSSMCRWINIYRSISRCRYTKYPNHHEMSDLGVKPSVTGRRTSSVFLSELKLLLLLSRQIQQEQSLWTEFEIF